MYLRGILRTREIHHRFICFACYDYQSSNNGDLCLVALSEELAERRVEKGFAYIPWSMRISVWCINRKYFNSTPFTFTISTFFQWVVVLYCIPGDILKIINLAGG